MNQRVENENQIVELQPKKEVAVSEQDGFLAMMERLAMANVDVEKIEKMMDLHERMQDRKSKMAFVSALADMQAELPEIDQKGEIVHEKSNERKVISKYAKFEDINEAVKPILQKHGFAISFRIKQSDGKIEVTAILGHRDGHSEETSMSLPADVSGAKNAVQAQGSTVAYGKRYTMCALLNITSRGEDDDATSTIDTEQAANIDNLLVSTKSKKEVFLSIYKVDDVRKIKVKDYTDALKRLNDKAKKVGVA